jgi:hypothetical protein
MTVLLYYVRVNCTAFCAMTHAISIHQGYGGLRILCGSCVALEDTTLYFMVLPVVAISGPRDARLLRRYLVILADAAADTAAPNNPTLRRHNDWCLWRCEMTNAMQLIVVLYRSPATLSAATPTVNPMGACFGSTSNICSCFESAHFLILTLVTLVLK